MRRLKRSILVGVLIGGGLWALFIIAALGTEDPPKDVYLFMTVSFFLFVLTTAAISLTIFYAIPTFIVDIALQHLPVKKCIFMQDNFEEHHTSMKFRYRLYTALVFAVAATIAMPVFHVVIAIFRDQTGPSAEKILAFAAFGAMFSIAAFFWGFLLTSRFRISEDKKPGSFIIVCFLWGCALTALTMFTTGLFLGLIESIRHMELSMKAIEYGLYVWGFGSVFTFGIVYVVGGAAGIIAGMFFRRVAG